MLAVEVVSPDSEARDRDTKPRKYAAAGIAHFWRVEMAGRTTARWSTSTSWIQQQDIALTGIHHDRLKLSVPYTIDIDLTEIEHL